MTTLDHKLPVGSRAGGESWGRFRVWIAGHPVASFFLFAYAFSWVLWLAPAFGVRSAVGSVLLVTGVFGPAIAAATVTRLTGGSLRSWFRELVRFRGAARWYALIIGFPIVLMAATTGLFALTGGAAETSLLGERLAAYVPLLVVWTLAGGGEEPGWRGFALPRLLETMTPVRATLVLGPLWALWHLPLLAAADEPSHGLSAVPLFGVTLLMLAAIVSYAFFYTFLWNRTHNVWLAILLHGSFSAAIGAFVLVPSDQQTGGTYAHLQVATLVLLVAAVLVLLLATRGCVGLPAGSAGSTTRRPKAGSRARPLVTGLVAISATLVAVASASAASPALDPTTSAEIDRFIEQETDARQVPGFALAIVGETGVVHARGFGSADGSGRPVTADTPFVLGSVTKSFTALAVMQLVDAGTVSLEAPVSRYVPELRLADGAEHQMTVRQLLNQTSGLPPLAGGRLLRSVGDGTLLDAVGELRGTVLSERPGTSFEYANANYLLLGLVIERASGELYGDYIQRHIFEPLGMRNSFARPDAAEAAGLAVGHRYWFGLAVEHGPTSPDAMRPAGYLMSSANDMARYLRMYLNGGSLDGRRLVSRDALEAMLRPVGTGALGPWANHQDTRYAMGWFVGGPWREPALLHPGRDPDSSAMIVLLPRQRLAVVTLANASLELPLPGGASSLQRIPSGVVSLLVGEEPSAGITFARFYLAFDAAVAVVLAALLWSLVRLLRRRQSVHSWRLAARMLRAAAEAGLGVFLLALPVLAGQGWPGVMLWTPDLGVVLLVSGGLLIATAGLRLLTQLLSMRRAVTTNVVRPAAKHHPPQHAGAPRAAHRPKFAPNPNRRRAPSLATRLRERP